MLTRQNVGGAMGEIVWSDLNPTEQRAIAALGAGFSLEVCNKDALKALKRFGLVRGRHLTPKAERCGKKLFCLRWPLEHCAPANPDAVFSAGPALKDPQ